MKYQRVEPPPNIFEFSPEKQELITEPNSTYTHQRIVEKLVFPKEGGVYAYYKGEKYPKRTCQSARAVQAVRDVKRPLYNLLRFISNHKWIIPIVIILRKSILKEITDFSHEVLREYYVKSQYLCTSGRAIYRRGDRCIGHTEVGKRLLKMICMIWEEDPPYRFIGQDIITDFDEKVFMKNPKKELCRILDLAIERSPESTGNDLKGKFRMARTIGKILLSIPSIKRRAIEISGATDWDDMRMDEADLYHAMIIPAYNFRGWDYEKRLRIRKQIDNNEEIVL